MRAFIFNSIRGWCLCLSLLVCLSGTALGQDWEHQSMAWVPGPAGTSVRSPDDSAQPTSLTWSIVPGGVAQASDASRVTDDFTDMHVTGLTTFFDYQAMLSGVMDAWASVADITNLGYVAESGDVAIGPAGLLFENRGPAAAVGHIRFMAFDQEALNGATAYAQATPIPEPGSPVDNTGNLPRAGDVRFRSDANLWDDLLGETYFRHIALHEVGHILGFGHNSVPGSVMHGPYTTWNLGAGDIDGAIFIYGPANAVPEPRALLIAFVGLLGLCCFVRRRRPNRGGNRGEIRSA